jgi:dTDP-4-amino-4,6-dideoxygalactose transaminase
MVPVLFPASPATWAIDQETLWRENAKFDAFIVVQPFGYKLDFARFDQLSHDLGKPVIYDCAAGFDFESHTTNAVCYSLHATKNLPVGEGGLISFASEFYCRRARMLANFDFDDNREPISGHGMNAKMDELHAPILTRAARSTSGVR